MHTLLKWVTTMEKLAKTATTVNVVFTQILSVKYLYVSPHGKFQYLVTELHCVVSLLESANMFVPHDILPVQTSGNFFF